MNTMTNFSKVVKEWVDTELVHNSGAETINGVKTFTSLPKNNSDNLATEPYVLAHTPIVVHLTKTGSVFSADYTFAQIIAAIEAMQWVILKYGEDTFTVYTRNASVVIWQSTIYINNNLGARVYTLTNQNAWYESSAAFDVSTSIGASPTNYEVPTVKAIKDYVDDQFGEHIVWNAENSSEIYATQTYEDDFLETNYQLTDLDMSSYKYVKCYIAPSTSGSTTQYTPPLVIEIRLDDTRLLTPYSHYMGAGNAMMTNYSDGVFDATIIISSDKTKVAFLLERAWTGTSTIKDRNSNGRYLYKITGFKN